MSLSADQFASLIRSLEASGAQDPNSEHRRAPRVTHFAPVVMIPAIPGQQQKPSIVYLRDLSAGGISLVRSQPMRRGNQFLVRLPRGTEIPIFMLYTIVACRPVKDGLFCLHAEFNCTISNVTGTPVATDFAELDRIRNAVLS